MLDRCSMDDSITPDALLVVLRGHIGRARGVTAAALTRELLGVEPSRGDERIVRKLVVQLRLDGQHVCAHPDDGYYLAETADELDQTIGFLRKRAFASLEQIAAMKRISLPDLFGQLKLPT